MMSGMINKEDFNIIYRKNKKFIYPSQMREGVPKGKL